MFVSRFRMWLLLASGLFVLGAILLLRGIAPADPPALPRLFQVPEFTLQNCTGETVTREDLSGKIWLVNFMFTRCTGPCPLLTRQMLSLQESLGKARRFAQTPGLQLVSISVDPAYDRPEVLREYARSRNARLDTWWFLTGPEEATRQLIRQGFRIAVQAPDPDTPPGGMLHGTYFLLVDEAGFVRAVYDPSEPHFRDRVLQDIAWLQSHPDREP